MITRKRISDLTMLVDPTFDGPWNFGPTYTRLQVSHRPSGLNTFCHKLLFCRCGNWCNLPGKVIQLLLICFRLGISLRDGFRMKIFLLFVYIYATHTARAARKIPRCACAAEYIPFCVVCTSNYCNTES